MSDEVTLQDFRQTMQVIAERLSAKPDAYSIVVEIERLKARAKRNKTRRLRKPATPER